MLAIFTLMLKLNFSVFTSYEFWLLKNKLYNEYGRTSLVIRWFQNDGQLAMLPWNACNGRFQFFCLLVFPALLTAAEGLLTFLLL